MAAYVIADINVHDPDTYKEYAALVQATLDRSRGTSWSAAAPAKPSKGTGTHSASS